MYDARWRVNYNFVCILGMSIVRENNV